MKRALLIFTALLSGCTNDVDTRRTLDDLGFKNIQTTGYAYFACGDDYIYHTNFRATNPNGKNVEGTVCCGVLKGCTVKF